MPDFSSLRGGPQRERANFSSQIIVGEARGPGAESGIIDDDRTGRGGRTDPFPECISAGALSRTFLTASLESRVRHLVNPPSRRFRLKDDLAVAWRLESGDRCPGEPGLSLQPPKDASAHCAEVTFDLFSQQVESDSSAIDFVFDPCGPPRPSLRRRRRLRGTPQPDSRTPRERRPPTEHSRPRSEVGALQPTQCPGNRFGLLLLTCFRVLDGSVPAGRIPGRSSGASRNVFERARPGPDDEAVPTAPFHATAAVRRKPAAAAVIEMQGRTHFPKREGLLSRVDERIRPGRKIAPSLFEEFQDTSGILLDNSRHRAGPRSRSRDERKGKRGMIEPIRFDDGLLELLDQRRLPHESSWFACKDIPSTVEAIREMVVRGAPAIGITAGYGMAVAAARALEGDRDFVEEIEAAGRALKDARPTAVNLAWAVDRLLGLMRRAHADGKSPSELRDLIEQEARTMHAEDIETNRRLGAQGAMLVPDGATVLTHCNAGALATAGFGTALGVVRAAMEDGKTVRLIADETRPFLQGARLTAWEMLEDEIPGAVIPDVMAGALMARGEIDLVVVGSDRIARNGDVANKIGTYMVAVLARRHGIPFYVAAPNSTIDAECPNGEMIPIEERNPREVTHVLEQRIVPEGIEVMNQAFDVTPAELVTAIITEAGIARPPYQHSIARLLGLEMQEEAEEEVRGSENADFSDADGVEATEEAAEDETRTD